MTTNFLTIPFQCLITFSVKQFFLVSNLNYPCCSLRLCPLLSLVAGRRPTPTCLHFLAVVESDKVIPEPLFLRAKCPRLPQLHLIKTCTPITVAFFLLTECYWVGTSVISAFAEMPVLCSCFVIGIRKHLVLFLSCLAELLRLEGICGFRWWLGTWSHTYIYHWVNV